MKIILISIGTLGDIEPFVAIGKLLKAKGHQVICAFPEQFHQMVEDSGLEFESLGTSFIEMLESEAGKIALGGGGSGFKKLKAYITLSKNSTDINKELLQRQFELVQSQKPDRIIYNGKAVYPIIWGLGNQEKTTLLSPVPYMHYVKDHTHLAFNSNFGTFPNKLTYALADFGMINTVRMSIKWLKIKERISRKQIKGYLKTNKVIYTISPLLFPRPEYWINDRKVLGFHAKEIKNDWQPSEGLKTFISKHSKILFVTFGSMLNPDPEGKTEILVDILQKNKIPAIINTASGGLIKSESADSNLIHFVSHIPYEWILPKVHGIIHHGGSGTTHLGLQYSLPALIIPHILDQFVWSKIISDLGAGPVGIRIDKIRNKNLEPKIIELVSNDSFKKKAGEIARQMNKENFTEELYQSIIS